MLYSEYTCLVTVLLLKIFIFTWKSSIGLFIMHVAVILVAADLVRWRLYLISGLNVKILLCCYENPAMLLKNGNIGRSAVSFGSF